MSEYRFPTSIHFALALACVAMLGGCGKKENSPAPAVPPSPPAQVTEPAPAPVAPEIAAPPASPAASTENAAATPLDAEAAMKKSDCFACHAVDKKMIGPAYSWVAYRYKDDKEAVAKLSAKIKNGGAGNWNDYTGGMAMTPHAQLPDDEIKTIAQWVLGQKPVEPPKK